MLTMKGKLPTKGTDIEELMMRALVVMQNMILRIFDQGGPDGEPWPMTKKGLVAFRGGSSFINTMRTDFDLTRAEVTIGTGIPYALAHQFGVTFMHPGSSKFQRFQIDGRWISTNYTKPHPITIPPRPYMVWQKPEIEQIKKLFVSELITFKPVEVVR